jgi:hypothetical protein
LYYILKYKKQFLHWLLISREKQIREKYHPKHLLDFIEKNPEADDEILDKFLNIFYRLLSYSGSLDFLVKEVKY